MIGFKIVSVKLCVLFLACIMQYLYATTFWPIVLCRLLYPAHQVSKDIPPDVRTSLIPLVKPGCLPAAAWPDGE